MISPEQIRAARALLDWPTAELARRTGLTVNGLNKIERGHVNAQRETLEKIQKVFEEAGLEFLPNKGLRRRDYLVSSYEGKNVWKIVFDDFLATLAPHDIFRMAFLDEEGLHKRLSISCDYLFENLETRQKRHITHRVLVPQNTRVFFPNYDTYRVASDRYCSPYPFFIYKNKLSLISWFFAPKAVIIEDERYAESVAKLFDFVWDHSKPVSKNLCLKPEDLKRTLFGRDHD